MKVLKKTKHIFYKCVMESLFTSISGPGGSILSKRVKIAVLCIHCQKLKVYKTIFLRGGEQLEENVNIPRKLGRS